MTKQTKRRTDNSVAVCPDKPHRPTLYAAHELTNAAPSGLGRTLAGTSSSAQMLAPAEAGAASAPAPPPVDEAMLELDEAKLELELELEVVRGQHLLFLKKRFTELCSEEGLQAPPMNAFERWRMLGAWSDGGTYGGLVSDPLLPSAAACRGLVRPALPPPADGTGVALRPASAWLADDLRRAGVTRPAAERVADALAEGSAAAARDLHLRQSQLLAVAARNRKRETTTSKGGGGAGGEASCADGVRVVDVEGERVELVWRGQRATLTRAMLDKLRSLFLSTKQAGGSGRGGGGEGGGNDGGGGEGGGGDGSGDEGGAEEGGENGGGGESGGDAGSGDEGGAEGGGVPGDGGAASEPIIERAFRLAALRLLLRYESIGCAGMHAAIGQVKAPVVAPVYTISRREIEECHYR